MTLSIGEVAAATGLRPSALRYYEDIGLIHSSGRQGGRRHYDSDVLSRLAFVALCQDVGFTLAEIATLLDDGSGTRGQWRHLAGRKLADVEHRMRRLEAMRRHLQAALACTCEHIEGCELVEDAAQRRRAHRAGARGPDASNRPPG